MKSVISPEIDLRVSNGKHTVILKQGVPRELRDELADLCLQNGAISADKVKQAVKKEEPKPKKKPSEKEMVDDVYEAVKQAFDDGDPDLFTAGGQPKLDVLADAVGYKVSGSIRDMAFNRFMSEQEDK